MIPRAIAQCYMAVTVAVRTAMDAVCSVTHGNGMASFGHANGMTSDTPTRWLSLFPDFPQSRIILRMERA